MGLVAVVVTHLTAAVLVASSVPLRATKLPALVEDHFGWASEPLLLAGGIGLAIFFCLSGYLISRPFVRAYLGADPLPSLGAFGANRLLRIVPAFWFAVTLYLVLFHRTGESVTGVAEVYLFVQNYQPEPGPLATSVGHAWSIDVELAFYLFLPAAAFLLTRFTPLRSSLKGRLTIVLGVAALGAVSSFAMLRAAPTSATTIHTIPFTLCYFLPGVMLAALEPVAVPFLHGKRAARVLAAGALGFGLLAFVAVGDSGDIVAHGDAMSGLRRTAEGAASVFGPSLLLAAPLILQWGGRSCPRALDNAPLRWLGERSYSLYLLHMLPIYLFRDDLTGLVERGVWQMLAVAIVIEFALLLPLAALSYRFVEKPFLSLKRARRSLSLRPEPAS